MSEVHWPAGHFVCWGDFIQACLARLKQRLFGLKRLKKQEAEALLANSENGERTALALASAHDREEH